MRSLLNETGKYSFHNSLKGFSKIFCKRLQTKSKYLFLIRVEEDQGNHNENTRADKNRTRDHQNGNTCLLGPDQEQLIKNR